MKQIYFLVPILLCSSLFAQKGTQVPKKTAVSDQSIAPKTKQIVKPENSAASNLIVLTVSPETVACSYNPANQCLQVKRQGSGDSETIEDIENFNYELGYTYTIQVKKMMKSPPIKINEPIHRYVWVKTLNKKETSVTIPESTAQSLPPKTPQSTSYTNNGKIIGQTSIISSSELDKKWYLRKMKESNGSSFVTDDNVMWIEIKTFIDRIDGFGACNKFATVLRSDLNTTFEISKLTSQYAMCGNKKIEDLFYDLLQQANRFEIKNGNLILSNQWNFLLGFTSNPDNKEDITSTYTPPTIVKTEDKTYATNQTITAKNEDKYTPPVFTTTTTETNTSSQNISSSSTSNNTSESAKEAVLEAKKKEIEDLKKQLDPQYQTESTTTNSQQESEIEALKKQSEEKKKQEAAAALLAKQTEIEKQKLAKQIEIEELKKQLEQIEKQDAITDEQIKTDKQQQTNSVSQSKNNNTSSNELSANSQTPIKNVVIDETKPTSTNSNTLSIFDINNNTDNSEYPEPKTNNVVYYKVENKLLFTEITTAIFKGNDKNTYLELSSMESKIQFSKNKIPKLIIKTDGTKPSSDFISLYACDLKKEKRQIYVRPAKNKVLTSFSEIAQNVYEIILPENLNEGEYVFIKQNDINKPIIYNTSNTSVFCFGVAYK